MSSYGKEKQDHIDVSNILVELERLGTTGEVYVAGGPVRDWLMGRTALDLDLVVPRGALLIAEEFSGKTGGRFVLLDRNEGVARVVCSGLTIDFSQYRENAKTLEEDLALRDFTINAMAVDLLHGLQLLRKEREQRGLRVSSILPVENVPGVLADPMGGRLDLERGIIRAISRQNLASDPLRLLRAYRFRAQLGFEIEKNTLSWIGEEAESINAVSPERILYELSRIFETSRAAVTLAEMAESGLLRTLLPELSPMEGEEQPGFHHLDVFRHSIETVAKIEEIIRDPAGKFSLCGPLKEWMEANAGKLALLKWAGLFHDIAKPATRAEKKGRPTFYHHDYEGAEMVEDIAKRLRWPRRDAQFVSRLVRLHMRPFHLLPDLRRGGPTKRAMRRLILETETDYPALFLLAMADSMAGCGPLKPPGLDEEIALLWTRVHRFYLKHMIPVKTKPRLLTGHDIQELFCLSPGPLIGKALDALEEAGIEGLVRTREEAEAWLKSWMDEHSNERTLSQFE